MKAGAFGSAPAFQKGGKPDCGIHGNMDKLIEEPDSKKGAVRQARIRHQAQHGNDHCEQQRKFILEDVT
jgi:uncharacterized Zn finger protein (UPF0148 family)